MNLIKLDNFLNLNSNSLLSNISNYLNENYKGYYHLSYDLKSKNYNYILITSNTDDIIIILNEIKKIWCLDLIIVNQNDNIYYLDFKNLI